MSCQDCSDTCGCAIGAGDGSISVTGNGSATTPYAVRARLSGQVDNALSLLGDGLYISSVTAMASGGTIVCTSSTRPPGAEGRQIFETDTNRLLVHYDGAWHGQGSAGRPWTQYQSVVFSSSGDGATVPTVIHTGAALLTAPYALRMTVRAYGYGGFSASSEQRTTMYLQDSDGDSLAPEASAVQRMDTVNGRFSGAVSMMGFVDYAAGQSCGFRFAYEVDLPTNVYIRAGFEISFEPR